MASNAVELRLTCECNNNSHVYASFGALKLHKKSQKHVSWERAKELRQLKESLTRLENMLLALKNTIAWLQRQNHTLTSENRALNDELRWWRC